MFIYFELEGIALMWMELFLFNFFFKENSKDLRNLRISKWFDPIFLFRFLQYSEQYMMDYCLKKPVHTVDGHDISLFEVKQAGLYISWKITSLRK